MLILPIKRKWFDMELSYEKTDEYREIKSYWIKRFMKWLGIPKGKENEERMVMLAELNYFDKPRPVMFKNGYAKNAPYFIAMCTPRIGTGKEEWGAEKGKRYFVLTIHEIIKEGREKKE